MAPLPAQPASSAGKIVGIVVAIIVIIIVVVVVLAAVMYMMVSGLIGGGQTARPFVNFSGVSSPSAGSWTFSPQPDRTANIAEYQVVVLNGSAVSISARALSDCLGNTTSCTGGGLTLRIDDIGGTNQLTSGDQFTLSGLQNSPSTDQYTVRLLWAQDSNQVGEVKIP